MILAVGDQDDRARLPRTRLGHPVEGLERNAERLSNRGALDRNQIRLHRLEEQRRRRVVQRQGQFQEGAAGKGNQRDTVSFQPLQQIGDLAPGTFEPAQFAARLRIQHEHRVRDVEGDHDVDALPVHLLPHEAPARLRQRRHEREHGDEHENRLQTPSRPADAGNQARQHLARSETTEQARAGAERVDVEQQERRAEPQEPKRVRPARTHLAAADQQQKRNQRQQFPAAARAGAVRPNVAGCVAGCGPSAHGSFLRRVSSSTTSSSSRNTAGATSQAKRSSYSM